MLSVKSIVITSSVLPKLLTVWLYVAVAPALYHRQHPNPKLGYDEMPAVQQYMGALRDDELVEDVNVAIDYLQNHYQRTNGQKIGIVGYCVGGRITYLESARRYRARSRRPAA